MKLNCPAEGKTIIFNNFFPKTLVLILFLLPAILPGITSAAVAKEMTLLESKPNRYENGDRIYEPMLAGVPVDSLSLDSLAKSLISQINADSIKNTMLELQSFKDRYTLLPSRRDIARWIAQKYTSYGFSSVEIDSFQGPVMDARNNSIPVTAWQGNVVATITGKKRPEEVIVIGGHYDSFSMTGVPPAPGADDDASGTAATMELARILVKNNFQPDVTIKFLAFGAEEMMSFEGVTGSKYYADMSRKNGMKIILMLNLDMIAYSPAPVNGNPIDISSYTGFEYLFGPAMNFTAKYSKLKATDGIKNLLGDSYSFTANGFPALFYMEHEFSPYYHSAQDLVEYCNMEYCTEAAKAAGSMLIWQSYLPGGINNFRITESGTGNSLVLDWDKPGGNDSLTYKLSVGVTSGVYSNTFTTPNNHYELGRLTEGTKYYIGIKAISPNGFESFVTEKSETPCSVPPAPLSLSQATLPHKLELNWQPNIDLDLLGYCIYRKDSTQQANALKINDGICSDTFFVDNTAENGKFYYYSIKAVDKDSNFSQSSREIKARIFSLDHGLLLINRTYDGSGSLEDPSYQQVDNYYKTLLQGLPSGYSILGKGVRISLLEMGMYSTVLIVHDAPLKFRSYCNYLEVEELKKYLDIGGKFIYLGSKPVAYFQSQIGTGADFYPGNFLFDYLKIKHYQEDKIAESNGAIALFSPYKDIRIDSVKAYRKDFHIFNIESLSARDEASQVYKYTGNFSSSLPQGNMNGLPVGVEYLGENYRTFVLSYPLYYIKQENAKDLINTIIQRINAPSGVEESGQAANVLSFELMQNYPNPFNPATTISYSIPKESFVELKVYDILGREVSTLVSSHMSRGEYKVQFNASSLPSGMYIYSIQAGEFRASKKLLLIK
ncbi:MAG TPA: M20/M25/M40 family metallo-hydrolase [Ignavibacteriales bacterium]|nr:M20/M25/M40 family metallo-hydrolase [Ignavibacteriales bacterium]